MLYNRHDLDVGLLDPLLPLLSFEYSAKAELVRTLAVRLIIL